MNTRRSGAIDSIIVVLFSIPMLIGTMLGLRSVDQAAIDDGSNAAISTTDYVVAESDRDESPSEIDLVSILPEEKLGNETVGEMKATGDFLHLTDKSDIDAMGRFPVDTTEFVFTEYFYAPGSIDIYLYKFSDSDTNAWETVKKFNPKLADEESATTLTVSGEVITRFGVVNPDNPRHSYYVWEYGDILVVVGISYESESAAKYIMEDIIAKTRR